MNVNVKIVSNQVGENERQYSIREILRHFKPSSKAVKGKEKAKRKHETERQST